MSLLYVLLAASFVPVEAKYEPAVATARKAALVQSGIDEQVNVVRRAAEKRVPKALKHAAVVGYAVHKQELRLRTKGTVIHLKKDSVSVSWGFSW